MSPRVPHALSPRRSRWVRRSTEVAGQSGTRTNPVSEERSQYGPCTLILDNHPRAEPTPDVDDVGRHESASIRAGCQDILHFPARVLVTQPPPGALGPRTGVWPVLASRSAPAGRSGRRLWRRDRRGSRPPRRRWLTSGTFCSYINTRCASRSIPPSAQPRWLSAGSISLPPRKCSPIATSPPATCGIPKKRVHHAGIP